MLGRRRIRVAVGIFVLAAVWNLMWTRATSYVSTHAVINAPLVSVHAPVDGTILAASPGLGTGVSAETPLFRLAAREVSPQDLIRLEGDLHAAIAEVGALSDEIAATRKLISRLAARDLREREIEIKYLTQRLLETKEGREQHRIRWDRAAEALERLRTLQGTGGIAGVKLREAELELQLADALIAEADARVAAVREELTAIEEGLPSPAGTGRRDAAFDRLDDMRITLNDLKTRRTIAEGRRAGLAMRLKVSTGARAPSDRLAPRAATSGVIWRASPPVGASAVQGTSLTEVLDCRRRFIEVVLNERVFERLEVGTQANVRLRGSDVGFVATIAFQRATGPGAALAATTVSHGTGRNEAGVRVYLALPPADISDPAVAARFCDVGRTAEVTIARPSLREQLPEWAAWLDALVSRSKSVAGMLLPFEAG